MWLGGQAPSELRRVGRLGDGWLPSFCTVDDVAEGWELVTTTAAERGRAIDPEHLGALVAYSHTGVPDAVRSLLTRRRPEFDPELVVPVGLDALRERLKAFTEVGASKFVVLPLDEPRDWATELDALAHAVGDLQNCPYRSRWPGGAGCRWTTREPTCTCSTVGRCSDGGEAGRHG